MKLNFYTVDAGERKSIPIAKQRRSSGSSGQDFREIGNFLAKGNFGILSVKENFTASAVFRFIELNVNTEVHVDFPLTAMNMAIVYCYRGICQFRSVTGQELITQTQVKTLYAETEQVCSYSILPTLGKPFSILIVVIPLSPVCLSGSDIQAEIITSLKSYSSQLTNTKAFLSLIDFQLSATTIVNHLIKPDFDIELIQSHLNVLLLTILCNIDQQNIGNTETEEWDPEKREAYLIAEEIILAMDEPWTIKKMAGEHHVNSNKLKILFKKHIGIPAAAFKINVRMQKARQLLTETNLSIQEISTMVGYSNPAQFSTMFRRKMGFSPNDLRKD